MKRHHPIRKKLQGLAVSWPDKRMSELPTSRTTQRRRTKVKHARTAMTLTKAACPVAQAILQNNLAGLKTLLDNGEAPDRWYPEEKDPGRMVGASALSLAISQRRLDMVRALLDAGADPNFSLHVHATPLAGAVNVRNLEIVHLLLKAGADVNMGCPLLAAAKNKENDMARLLLDWGADPNATYPMTNNFLHSVRFKCALTQAIANDNYELFTLLLEAGANPAWCNVIEGGQVMSEAIDARRPEFLNDLLASGVLDPLAPSRHQILPMELAASSPFGDTKVPLLLAHGAPVTSRELVALAAVNRACPQVIDILLKAGADPDPSGMSLTLKKAVWNGNIHGAEALLEAGVPITKEILESALEQGASKAALLTVLLPRTPPCLLIAIIMEGIKTTDQAMVLSVLQQTCTPEDLGGPIGGARGRTLLHSLVAKRWPATRLTQALDAKWCAPNSQDQAGNTPLHLLLAPAQTPASAAQVRALLEAGADPNLSNRAGQRPIDYAPAHLCELLLDYGAEKPRDDGPEKPAPATVTRP